MMVATAFPPSAAPQVTKGPAAGPAVSSAAEGEASGFSGTLLQLLGIDASAEFDAAAITPLVQAVLQTLDDDKVPKADLPVPVALPFMQPLAVLATQLSGRPGQGEPALPALNAAGANVLPALSAEDIAQALQAMLKDGTADAAQEPSAPASQFVQSAALPAPSQEISPALRTTGGETGVPRHVQTDVGTAAWSDELGARLNLMAEKGQHAASLRLSPEHLGPLEVQISVQDDQATVWFGAAHADTRAALEQALPRLRELFAAQGMSLAQTGVFQDSPRDTGQSAPARGAAVTGGEGAEAEASTIATVVRRGLVDTWA